jgi:hypothetical protein
VKEEGDDMWGLQISDRRVFGGHPSPYQNMMTCVCLIVEKTYIMAYLKYMGYENFIGTGIVSQIVMVYLKNLTIITAWIQLTQRN